ncbi:MAG: glycoside hydrolase family 15 protein, partial [bacterium]|nr:glycoside hydrolase family 15 protein [bacterium]
MPEYPPIEDHGLIGNMRTAALVGTDGAIDWLCYPRFDSPAVFCSLLDHARGGAFRIDPHGDDITRKQFYWPETNVLVTRFLSTHGVAQITDYMPVERKEGDTGFNWIVRHVHVVRGCMTFDLDCTPAFDFARAPHQVEIHADRAVFTSEALSLELSGHQPLSSDGRGAQASFDLREGKSTVFVLREHAVEAETPLALDDETSDELFRTTVKYWRKWLSRCTYKGRWREHVHRSALVLKLMTYEPTGAIVAAPTTSLPETLGGPRNWDYRYTWIRDAAFTVYAFLRIGFTEEAKAFMQFLEARCGEINPDGSLQIMYGIDGRHSLPEETLDHLEGYRASRPVRIGNGAYDQMQLDIYGELMDCVYLANKYAQPISFDLWDRLRGLVDWVCDHWHERDEGIWEVRGGQQHFVYSKLMCWVALDRGLRLADKRSFPADRERWQRVRDEIYEEIMDRGWSPTRQAFTQSYGSDALDASALIMPLVFFLSPTDPRMLNTIDAINRSPKHGGLVSDSLVHRYDVEKTEDGLSGEEGTFNLCTVGLIEAMARAGIDDQERLDDARLLFDQMIGYANHLGLYAEETGSNGEALGN